MWELIKNHMPQIVCMVETRANKERCILFCMKLSRDWDWVVVPALGMSGGILTLWRKGLGSFTLLMISRSVLYLVISSNHMDGLTLSIVYNSQALSTQIRVWNELSKLSRIGVPWVIVGDFNTVESEDEHLGGNFNHYATKSNYFNDFISFNNLFGLDFSGPSFTWCNGQLGGAHL